MRSTHIRNMFGLYWQKVDMNYEILDMKYEIFKPKFLISHISSLISHISYLKTAIFLIISTLAAYSQTSKPVFQSDYDAKKIKFGYFIGIPTTHFGMEYNNSFVYTKDTSSAYSINSPNTTGLKMGGVMNIRIDDNFDFRILPTVAIYGRRIDFKYTNIANDVSQLRETAWFEVPVMVKYKSERRGNVRMYVFAGVSFAAETNAVNRKGKQQYSTTSTNFSIDYGTGIEFFKEYFKFAPELHFSHGIVNLVDPVFNKNSPLGGISSLTTHTVTLYFLFE
jgi:Outer membrane protein beta-barrel domain